VHHGAVATPRLPFTKRLVVIASGILTIVGIFDAVENLPMVSGCAFYSECDEGRFRSPPSAMGRDVPSNMAAETP
jgi:hypothetical protein